MGDGYSRSPKLLKGAIVQFVEMPIIPIPNIIIFQYNPESLQRTLTPYRLPEAGASGSSTPASPANNPSDPLVQPWDPNETFNVQLFLDATDAREAPESHPVAFIAGVADRLAALEMLVYPQQNSILGGLLGDALSSLTGSSVSLNSAVGQPEVPVILFIWGPGRIVPVRLQTFNVEEQAWNQLLYPTRAKVTLGMQVVPSTALRPPTGEEASTAKEIAMFCYDFTRAQKELLALANIANTVESILGILPF